MQGCSRAQTCNFYSGMLGICPARNTDGKQREPRVNQSTDAIPQKISFAHPAKWWGRWCIHWSGLSTWHLASTTWLPPWTCVCIYPHHPLFPTHRKSVEMNRGGPDTQNPVLSGAEVAEHNSRDSCWVIVHGKAYDVTEVGGRPIRQYIPS